MIRYVTGDLFKSSAKTLVNPVDCSGSMDSGVSAEMKSRFPVMFNSYNNMCINREVELGNVYAFVEMDVKRRVPPDQYKIINFPTNKNGSSHLDYIRSGLNDLADFILNSGTTHIAIPALGCGRCGLKWVAIQKIFEEWHAAHPDLRTVNIEIYEPIITKTNPTRGR